MEKQLMTERLILRPWQESDLENLYHYASHPEVGPICGWTPHRDLEESRWVLKNILMVPETYAMVLRESGEAIGSISLLSGAGGNLPLEEGECELGYWLGRPHWGQGLTTEAAKALLRHAFEDLGCKGVWIGHVEGNDRSRRVIEKCGFRYRYTGEPEFRSALGEIRAGLKYYLSHTEWRK